MRKNVKRCKCFGSDDDIVEWEAPKNRHEAEAPKELLHICTRCGHVVIWPDMGHEDAERESSPQRIGADG